MRKVRSEEEYLADYRKYRGKCKEMAEAAMKADPLLSLVRGFYICEVSGKQPHWWTVKPDGSIFDPSCKQFPSGGSGEYIAFNGELTCSVCNRSVSEADFYRVELGGKDILCSVECCGEYIGYDS